MATNLNLTAGAALAALLSAFNPAQAQSVPYSTPLQCVTNQPDVRTCRNGDHSFVEITQPDFQVVTGELNGELVTCVTWGLSSIKNGQVSASTDVDQICIWGVDGPPVKSPSVRRQHVL